MFDTESKTGVYVNGNKIEKSEKLSDGDVIAFGTAIMKFYMGSEANNDITHKKDEISKHSRLVNIVDNTEFNLDGDYITIGRQAGSNIEISAPYVSRNQAEIFKQNNHWFIVDYGKVTKITLNGEQIFSETPLYDGDVIKIGDFAFLYEEN